MPYRPRPRGRARDDPPRSWAAGFAPPSAPARVAPSALPTVGECREAAAPPRPEREVRPPPLRSTQPPPDSASTSWVIIPRVAGPDPHGHPLPARSLHEKKPLYRGKGASESRCCRGKRYSPAGSCCIPTVDRHVRPSPPVHLLPGVSLAHI